MSIDRDTPITYLGHSTFLIVTPDNRRVLLDPWTISNPACPPEWKTVAALGALDLILMTHLHNDHVGDAEEILRGNPDVTFVGNFEGCNWIKTKGARNTRPMNKGGKQSVLGVEITMTHAFHSSSYQERDGTVVYGGEAAGYILKMSNGFTIYAAGDTALFGDMELIREYHRPDLALLPIGDLFTMGPTDAARAIRLLQAPHVIPIHYATFPALTGTPEMLKAQTGDIRATEIHVISPGATIL